MDWISIPTVVLKSDEVWEEKWGERHVTIWDLQEIKETIWHFQYKSTLWNCNRDSNASDLKKWSSSDINHTNWRRQKERIRDMSVLQIHGNLIENAWLLKIVFAKWFCANVVRQILTPICPVSPIPALFRSDNEWLTLVKECCCNWVMTLSRSSKKVINFVL